MVGHFGRSLWLGYFLAIAFAILSTPNIPRKTVYVPSDFVLLRISYHTLHTENTPLSRLHSHRGPRDLARAIEAAGGSVEVAATLTALRP